MKVTNEVCRSWNVNFKSEYCATKTKKKIDYSFAVWIQDPSKFYSNMQDYCFHDFDRFVSSDQGDNTSQTSHALLLAVSVAQAETWNVFPLPLIVILAHASIGPILYSEYRLCDSKHVAD